MFALTLAALYGLGMMLASLFLLWGREAFHMTKLVIEPVYFVSGLNFPVGRLGALGALAIATIPFAVGLDAMRQLVFAGQPYITGTPSPEVEALILVAMTVVFTLLARWMIRRIERMARARGSAVDPLAMTRRAPVPDAASRSTARRSTPRGPRAPARRHDPQPAHRPARSAGGSRPTGPTRSCS